MPSNVFDFAEWFIAQARRVVQQEKRAIEFQAWAARLQPHCKTCTAWPGRQDCPGRCRAPSDLTACSAFVERPETALEREIAVAAFEAVGQVKH
jgi:hypothetical protein